MHSGREIQIQLAPNLGDHRADIDNLIRAAMQAADPAIAVKRYLRREGATLFVAAERFDMSAGRVFIVGVGKAAAAMAATAAQVMGDSLDRGIVVTKAPSSQDGPATAQTHSAIVTTHYAGHPISDQRSLDAAGAVEMLLQGATADDLVLFLISGGASALLSRPLVPLQVWQKLNELLLESGCTIGELNTVRRRLDRVKGGGLARMAFPAKQASLILSDVVGNQLEAIGSGPTVLNPDTVEQARDVLSRYDVARQLGEVAWQQIEGQLAIAERENLSRVEASPNLIIGDVAAAASAVSAAATGLGFSSQVLTTHLEGEAREVGKVIAALALDATPNSCLVFGGETTVTVRGDGIGGRNQELALSAALSLEGSTGKVVASFASDGEDGSTGAAGAVITGDTVRVARAKGLNGRDYLERNDSYGFFLEAGGLLETGPTGTNVNDLVFALYYE